MYIAIIESYIICSVLNYNWLYNNEKTIVAITGFFVSAPYMTMLRQ